MCTCIKFPISKFCLINKYKEAPAHALISEIKELQCFKSLAHTLAHCSVSFIKYKFRELMNYSSLSSKYTLHDFNTLITKHEMKTNFKTLSKNTLKVSILPTLLTNSSIVSSTIIKTCFSG